MSAGAVISKSSGTVTKMLNEFIQGDENYTLYIHIAPNGKMYIGITGNNVNARWKNGLGYRGSYFSRAINKYGWNNFIHSVVATNLTKSDAIMLEKEFISVYRTTERDRGYNISLGGEVPSNNVADIEEYRVRQSLKAHESYDPQKHFGHNKNYMPPKNRVNPKRKKVIQYDKDGKVMKEYDSVHEAAKALNVCPTTVSESCNRGIRCKGYRLSFESKDMLADGIRGSFAMKQVVQMDIDGNDISSFRSATEAARRFGRTSPCSILDACKGKQITAYGYRWRFQC